MGSEPSPIYSDPDSIPTYAGDPFTGIPISSSVVEEVAADYNVSSSELARALRSLETTPSLPTLKTLFLGFDPLPVHVDDSGHLFLRVEANSYWDVVAEELELTTTGRDALEAAHDRQVTDVTAESPNSSALGIVVSCPEFPSAAIDDICLIRDRTALSNRQSTIWALAHQARSPAAIAALLGFPESLVRAEFAKIEQAADGAIASARAFAGHHESLSFRSSDPLAEDWLGLNWSPWYALQDRRHLLDILPREPGLYRVRHTRVHGILYIGETGSEGGLRSRVGLELSDGLTSDTPPEGGRHDATRGLWKIAQYLDDELQVSIATPPIAADQRHRRAIEAALVASCRREIGWTPSVQLNRTPFAENPSGSDPRSTLETRSEANTYPVPDWTGWRAVTSPHWMGFEWCSPRPLSDRDTVDHPSVCAFRVWIPQDDVPHWDRTLTYLGTTETPVSRLFSLENTYGSESLFTIAPLTDLSKNSSTRSRERSEIWNDLVGAHYLSVGQPPTDQF